MYMRKTFFVFMVILFSFAGSSALADSVSEKRTFYVDSSYDLNARDEVGAVLVRVTPKLYFYVDQDWWNFAPQNKVYEYLTELDQEFENNIYPNLTSVFARFKSKRNALFEFRIYHHRFGEKLFGS
jgi:hypothetical protein